jgi:formylglycine-generating enzyme required for sulfatase activity
MLSELGTGSASDLPLLQFACRALWDGRNAARRTLRRATYDRIGGVAGALAQHADGVIDGMTLADQGVARQVFLRLLVGTARRTVPRAQLEAELLGAGQVLDRLVSSRLVIQRTSVEAVSVIEIAHEALLRSWARLQGWLDDTRDERRLVAELEEAAALWRKRGRRAEETWSSEEIAAARHRLATLGLVPPASIEEFLATGELRQRFLRRRARRRLALAAVTALAVTTLSVMLAGEFRRQKLAAEQQTTALRLAGNNLGRVELVIAPFDWIGDRPVAVAPALLPALTWRVFAARAGDQHTPGAELPPEVVRHDSQTVVGVTRVDRAELPGGTAFLRFDGRGRPGESCAPSWIRIQALPGYASRGQDITRIPLVVPTCAASAAGMIDIEAGPFIYGGAGEPKVRISEKVEPEQVIDLPAFAIDRTEVSNAQFAPFARIHQITGYPAPDYPVTEVHKDAGNPRMPVSAIDGFEAEAFCRFMGKRLPGDHEWVKAARGGLMVHGTPNPAPRRLYPWGTVWANCSNDDGDADGYFWVAPVDAFPCGASPYGVLNLAGNVAEWISREGQTDRAVNPLWVIRGGEVDAPTDLQQSTTVVRNEREGRQFTFAVGFRCVSGGQDQ